MSVNSLGKEKINRNHMFLLVSVIVAIAQNNGYSLVALNLFDKQASKLINNMPEFKAPNYKQIFDSFLGSLSGRSFNNYNEMRERLRDRSNLEYVFKNMQAETEQVLQKLPNWINQMDFLLESFDLIQYFEQALNLIESAFGLNPPSLYAGDIIEYNGKVYKLKHDIHGQDSHNNGKLYYHGFYAYPKNLKRNGFSINDERINIPYYESLTFLNNVKVLSESDRRSYYELIYKIKNESMVNVNA